jgi:anthranilate/para-aminobenzoate synthase component I
MVVMRYENFKKGDYFQNVILHRFKEDWSLYSSSKTADDFYRKNKSKYKELIRLMRVYYNLSTPNIYLGYALSD